MYRLCGGTFFVLLSNSKKKGKETDLLRDMLKILNPNVFFGRSNIKEQTKKFKLCKEHSCLATDFENSELQEKITNDIYDSYSELLKKTNDFIDNYIDTKSITHKAEILVKAVLEVIEQDDSISADQEFYILPNGESVTKGRLVFIKKVYLPSFILGVLYYVMMNIEDNKEGAETYDEWCPKPNSGTKRKYTANIGENSHRQIVVIKNSGDYDGDEISYLPCEINTLYLKPSPASEEYCIINPPLIIADSIDINEKEEYLELSVSCCDYKKLKEFVDDCNELICCVNKYRNSVKHDELLKLGKTKQNFFNKWLFYPHRFESRSIREVIDPILALIEKNKIIDINNIVREVIPIELNLKEIPVMKIKIPQYHYLVRMERDNTSDQRANNNKLEEKNNKVFSTFLRSTNTGLV